MHKNFKVGEYMLDDLHNTTIGIVRRLDIVRRSPVSVKVMDRVRASLSFSGLTSKLTLPSDYRTFGLSIQNQLLAYSQDL